MTADLDAHDLGLTRDGDLVFVNTLYSCVSRTSQQYSFEPIWQPPYEKLWVLNSGASEFGRIDLQTYRFANW